MKHKVKRAVFGIEHARSNEASSGEKDDRQQTPSQRELPWPLRMVGWRLHYFFQRYSDVTRWHRMNYCVPRKCVTGGPATKKRTHGEWPKVPWYK